MFDTYVITVKLAKICSALDVEYGTNSTYLHTHMPKINSSCVKISESSRPLLAQKFSIVTRAVVMRVLKQGQTDIYYCYIRQLW